MKLILIQPKLGDIKMVIGGFSRPEISSPVPCLDQVRRRTHRRPGKTAGTVPPIQVLWSNESQIRGFQMNNDRVQRQQASQDSPERAAQSCFL